MGIRGFLAGDLLTNRETSARFHDGAAEARLAHASFPWNSGSYGFPNYEQACYESSRQLVPLKHLQSRMDLCAKRWGVRHEYCA